MKESAFQSKLIGEIKQRFPGCMVSKNDANRTQGIPDLLILHEDRWAALECKRSEDSSHQPNQDYYVEKMNQMSYASFVCPENREKVLDELQQALKPRRSARVSRR